MSFLQWMKQNHFHISWILSADLNPYSEFTIFSQLHSGKFLDGHLIFPNPLGPSLKQGTNLECPREPWHDLHCKIDGPAAYDVLTNFEERWLKASKPHGIKRLKKSMYDDALLRIERIPDIIGMHDISYSSENDPEAWHVQVNSNMFIAGIGFHMIF